MKKQYYLELLSRLNPPKNKPFHIKKDIVIEKLEKAIRGEKLTKADEIELVNCIHTSALTGKLEDFTSVSSSVAENEICKARSQNCNSICHKCYAKQSVEYRSNLKLALLINHIVLNCFDISIEAWKTLSIASVNGKARIESHGDVASVTASDNMVKIVISHDWLYFGVWTKNDFFYYRTFQKYGKPGNMSFIVSSDTVNVVAKLSEHIKPYVDHVFTVYDLKYVIENNIEIQCGYHKCKNCLLCYTENSDTFYVNEILKSDTKAYKKYFGIE